MMGGKFGGGKGQMNPMMGGAYGMYGKGQMMGNPMMGNGMKLLMTMPR